jgi:hypothetical protein
MLITKMLFYQRQPSEAFLFLRMVSCAHAWGRAGPPRKEKEERRAWDVTVWAERGK